MIVSGYKSSDIQLELFDRPLTGHGQIRTIVGEWAEDLSATFWDLRRHKTDSRADYCPDLSNGTEFVESKAVGRSGQVFVYSGRLDKDWLFAVDHVLYYCIWHHKTDTTRFSTRSELVTDLYRTLDSMYLVPFHVMYSTMRRKPCSKLNSKYGKQTPDNETYGSGYRASLSAFDDYRMVF